MLRTSLAAAATVAASLAASAAPAAAAPAGADDGALDVLVVGDHEGRTHLAAHLGAAHANVTVRSTLPTDLSSFDVVWHVGAYHAMSIADTDRLYEVLASGRGVLLTGERTGFEQLNQSVQRLVDAVVAQPGVRVGGLGEATGVVHHLHDTVVAGLGRHPNLVTDWKPAVAGRLAGVEARSVLASDAAKQVTAAAWSGEQLVTGGQLVVMMDADWYGVDLAAPALVANLAQFLYAPVGLCGDGFMHGAEQCDDGNLVAGDTCSATCTEERPELEPGTPDTNPAGAGDDAIDTDGATTPDDDTAAEPEVTAGCAAGGGHGATGGVLLLAALALAARRRRA